MGKNNGKPLNWKRDDFSIDLRLSSQHKSDGVQKVFKVEKKLKKSWIGKSPKVEKKLRKQLSLKTSWFRENQKVEKKLEKSWKKVEIRLVLRKTTDFLSFEWFFF